MVKYKNWSREVVWTPKEVVYPSSLEQLKKIVFAAKERGLKIRAIGSLHSYGLCVTEAKNIILQHGKNHPLIYIRLYPTFFSLNQ